MADVSDSTRALAWSALLLLFFRSLSVCTFLFVSINANIFVRSSIQVHSGGKEAPFTTRNRNARPDPHGCDDKRVAASDHRGNHKRNIDSALKSMDLINPLYPLTRVSSQRSTQTTTGHAA